MISPSESESSCNDHMPVVAVQVDAEKAQLQQQVAALERENQALWAELRACQPSQSSQAQIAALEQEYMLLQAQLREYYRHQRQLQEQVESARAQAKAALARAAELSRANAVLGKSLGRLSQQFDPEVFLAQVVGEIVNQMGAANAMLLRIEDNIEDNIETDSEGSQRVARLHLFHDGLHPRWGMSGAELPLFAAPFSPDVTPAFSIALAAASTAPDPLSEETIFVASRYSGLVPIEQFALPGGLEWMARIGASDAAFIVLFADDRPIGTLHLHFTGGRQLRPEDDSLFLALSKQATIALLLADLAIHNCEAAVAREQEKAAQERAAELEQKNADLQQRDRLLSAVAKITQDLLNAEDIDAAIPAALQTVAQASDIHRVLLLLERQDPVTQRWQHYAAHKWVAPGFIDPGLSVTDSEDFASVNRTLKQGQSYWYVVDDLPEAVRLPFQALGIQSVGAAPVFVEGAYIGCLAFDDCVQPRSWSQQEIDVLVAAAESIGAALYRKRLTNRLVEERARAAQQRVAQLACANTALKKTIDVLATEPDLDRSLGHVLQVTTEHLGSPSAALWLTNPDGETFSLHLVYVNGRIIPATPRYADQLSGHWIRGRDLSRDLILKTHIRERAAVIYDIADCPDISPAQRQFLEGLGVYTLLGIPLLLGSEVVGSFTVRFTERRQFSAEELELTQALAHQATLVIQLMQLAEEAKQTALLEERNRLAGEIHDTLAQAFTGISIQVGMAQKLVTSSPIDTQQILDRVLSLSQTGLAEARRSIWALHPTADEYANLAHNLQTCLHYLTDGLPMQVTLEQLGTPELVPAIVGQNLLRIAQEAINNAIRHAQATQLRVRLICDPATIVLSIQDNGRGFEPDTENGGGFGLMGMSERASRLNGQFTLRSQPGQGTEVSVEVSLKEE